MLTLEIGGRRWEPDIRRLSDMRDLLCDTEWASSAEDVDLYYMYRDLYLSRADRSRLIEHDLRYDITIIPPRMLGREYVKTAGHYHPKVPGTDVTYPEVYEVLEGEALYLLQNEDASSVVCIAASEGDKVIIPPGYGHVTVNRSNKRLKMANFVCRSFSSIYGPYRDLRGGAYYCTRDGFVKNPRYRDPAPLRRLDAPDDGVLKRFGLSRSREMYSALKDPGRLEFLTKPHDHLSLFEGILG
ncbi:MAG: glucose-6-phosphate isomerase family protein [Methanothrix sp.]